MIGVAGILLSRDLLMYLAYRGITVLLAGPVAVADGGAAGGDTRMLAIYTQVFTRCRCRDSAPTPSPLPSLGSSAGVVMLAFGGLWLNARARRAKAAGEGYGDHPSDALDVSPSPHQPPLMVAMAPLARPAREPDHDVVGDSRDGSRVPRRAEVWSRRPG
jgi:hypothetical protein